jgi:hypothetical protein
MPAGKKKSGQRRSARLSQLQFPLMFYGFSLSVLEGIYGVCFTRYAYSERVTLLLACLMAMLFLVVVFLVTFLIYKVPEHIMLRAQTRIHQDTLKELDNLRDTLQAFSGQARNPEALLTLLDQVERSLKGSA